MLGPFSRLSLLWKILLATSIALTLLFAFMGWIVQEQMPIARCRRAWTKTYRRASAPMTPCGVPGPRRWRPVRAW